MFSFRSFSRRHLSPISVMGRALAYDIAGLFGHRAAREHERNLAWVQAYHMKGVIRAWIAEQKAARIAAGLHPDRDVPLAASSPHTHVRVSRPAVSRRAAACSANGGLRGSKATRRWAR